MRSRIASSFCFSSNFLIFLLKCETLDLSISKVINLLPYVMLQSAEYLVAVRGGTAGKAFFRVCQWRSCTKAQKNNRQDEGPRYFFLKKYLPLSEASVMCHIIFFKKRLSKFFWDFPVFSLPFLHQLGITNTHLYITYNRFEWLYLHSHSFFCFLCSS